MTADTHARLVELLESPDPPELKNRGHRLTQPGKGAKTQRRIWLRYAVTFEAYRRFDIDESRSPEGTGQSRAVGHALSDADETASMSVGFNCGAGTATADSHPSHGLDRDEQQVLQ